MSCLIEGDELCAEYIGLEYIRVGSGPRRDEPPDKARRHSRPFGVATAGQNLNNRAAENVMNVMRSCFFAIAALLLSVTCAAAQLPPPTVVPPAPNLNPSSSLVLPPLQQTPVSPAPSIGGSLLHHYHSVCSGFRHKP